MITVRFANGHAVTYDKATEVRLLNDGYHILVPVKKGVQLSIATISSSAMAIFESMPPSKIETTLIGVPALFTNRGDVGRGKD